jgi:thiol:disulfide interchange protein DsbD
MRLIYLFSLILISFNLFAKGEDLLVAAQNDDLLIKSISEVRPWSEGLTQEIKIEVSLPKGYHAYKDQFKILNLLPDGFSAGSLSLSPEKKFFDKYSQKERLGLYESGAVKLFIEAASKNVDPMQKIKFDLRYQICSDAVCQLPKNLPVEIGVNELLTDAGRKITMPVEKSFSFFTSLDELLKSSLLLSFLSVFIAGILTSFTPCIFPMLPITISILGYHADKNSRFKNFSRSLAYVLGIALTYSTLGVVAALTGSLFGSMLTNKYVLALLVMLFLSMALSMWGVFEIQAPAFIRNRFGVGKSHSLLGAFVMGLVAGIVASPCVGPVLVSILTYVSTTKNAVLGFSLLFTFALGLGLIFIVIGLFSSALKLLPKSGAWMNRIKFVLGAGMWGAALYYTQFLIPQRAWIFAVAASFIGFAVWKGAFNFKARRFVQQSILLAVFIFSSAVAVTIVFTPQYLTTSLYKVDYQNKESENIWLPYSEDVLMQAQKEGRPVLIDFYADWCGACHELDDKTYATDEFKQISKLFTLVKFNATEDNEDIQRVLKKYDVKGLPTVLFINRNGNLLKELAFTQFLTMNELKPKMEEALK